MSLHYLVITLAISGAILLFTTASIERSTKDVNARNDTIEITHLGYLMLALAGLFHMVYYIERTSR